MDAERPKKVLKTISGKKPLRNTLKLINTPLPATATPTSEGLKVKKSKEITTTTTKSSTKTKTKKDGKSSSTSTSSSPSEDIDLDSLFDLKKQKRKENKIIKEQELKEKEIEEATAKVSKKKKNADAKDDFFDSRGVNFKERKIIDGLPVFSEEELGLNKPYADGDNNNNNKRFHSTSTYNKNNNNNFKLNKKFMKPYIGAIDQGTSSTRFILFDKNGDIVLSHQILLTQHHPHPGWVEHDGNEILESVNKCIEVVMKEYYENNFGTKEDIKAIGITNQRETTIVWDKKTSKPLNNAIVWCDTRTKDLVNYFNNKANKLIDEKDIKSNFQIDDAESSFKEECDNISTSSRSSGGSSSSSSGQQSPKIKLESKNYLREKCGLPLSSYFSGLKLKWLFDNCEQVREAYKRGDCLMGTIDSWLIWNLTGGKSHMTDVTNASRTMLMDLKTLSWDKELCDFLEVPIDILPEIHSSSEIYGSINMSMTTMMGTHQLHPLDGIPIAGVLGDQQAAMVGQMCFEKGQAKNTYGTGCFLLYNTGNEIVHSRNGLLTTVCYQLGKNSPPVYALEGGVAVAGSGVRWLIDNMGIAKSSQEIEDLATSVQDTGGMYFVPAFSGLFAPYWRDDARGVMVGLTHHTNRCHIARSVLESTCLQTYEVLDAMQKDSGNKLVELRVDGGMAKNNLLLQIQSDLLGLPVVKPTSLETTCFGAAFAAGIATGVWKETMEFKIGGKFTPILDENHKTQKLREWKKAISKSLDWIDSKN
ncbi:hypothetical protein ACTA71_009081 [Dictyostelium dimigraforme]